MCRCVETMDIVVGKEKRDLFTKGKVYHCVIHDDEKTQINYKIYGDEYDLSCTENEFNSNFVIIKNKKTGIKND